MSAIICPSPYPLYSVALATVWLTCDQAIFFFLNRLIAVYRVVRNFCGSLFLRSGDSWSFARTNFYAIWTDWFFLLGINFCDFQKEPSTQH